MVAKNSRCKFTCNRYFVFAVITRRLRRGGAWSERDRPTGESARTKCERCLSTAAQAQFGCLVFITSSCWSSSSGTKPRPPHVGHCCSSSVPFSTTPSPLQSGQVFMCTPHGMLPHPRDYIRWCLAGRTVAKPFTAKFGGELLPQS